MAYRARSEAEVRQYLRRRGYVPTVAGKVIDKLRSFRYLNDEEFARGWALTRARDRSYGAVRIDRELRSKGVEQALIRAVVKETFAQVDERASAERLLTKRFKGESLREPKTTRRAAAYLQRRGYSSKVILDLLGYSLEEDS